MIPRLHRLIAKPFARRDVVTLVLLVIDLYESGVKPHEMVDYLLEKKIFTREGSYTSELFGHRYLRVSFSIPKREVEYFADCFLEGMEELTGDE